MHREDGGPVSEGLEFSYLFYSLLVVLEVIHLSFAPLVELLKDLSSPRCCLGRCDRQTHGLDRLHQS